MTTYSQQVTWTVLPNGVDPSTGNLRFSVHIAPRLMSSDGLATTLRNWANWVSWPATLVGPSGSWGDPAGVTFAIQFDSGPSVSVMPVSAAPQASPWTALFSASSPVSPYGTTPDLSQKFIHSYPASHIRDYAKNNYLALHATFPNSRPTADALLNGFVVQNEDLSGFTAMGGETGLSPAGATGGNLEDPMGGNSGSYPDVEADDPNPPLSRPAISNGDEVNNLNPEGNDVPPGGPGWVGQVKQMLHSSPNRAIPFSSAANPQTDFTQAYLYHQPMAPPSATPLPTPQFDFHQMLAFASHHPALLRLLGLVVDFEVAAPSSAPSKVMMVVTSPTTGTTITPATACFFGTNEFGLNQFIAASRTAAGAADIANGALPFDDPSTYQVIELDTDSAGLHLLNFSRQVYRATNIMQSDDTPLTYTPPTFRSPGLSVLHIDWAVRQNLNFASQAALETNGPTPTVYAEDITRGYYIHAFSPLHGVWHSLGMRTGSYSFPNSGQTFTASDEAAITLSPTSTPGQDLSDVTDMNIQPAIFHWNGWSLAAGHPGNSLQEDQTLGSNPSTPPPGAAFNCIINFQAQSGTLPLLRYGQAYQFRARAADLAGNSLPFGSYTAGSQDPHATLPTTYGRFESISQPAVLLVAPPTPGESAERIVIRSNYNTPATATSARHLVPPRTAQLMAELSGAFDTATGPDPNAYELIVDRADGKLSRVPSATSAPNASVPGTFYYPTDSLEVPYLPDVYARGAALLDLPGTPPGTVQQVTFIPPGTQWPNYVPIQLVLQEGTAAPSYHPGVDQKEDVLTVSIPKAQVAPVQLSCYLNAGDLVSMGQWQWILGSQAFTPAQIQSLQSLATQGQMWALTPFRELILVHAVRQPLATPEFSAKFTGLKTEFGQTWAELIDTMNWDRSSTSKVHVTAKWVEWVDTGPGGPPPTQAPTPGQTLLPASSSIAFDVNLTAGDLQPKPNAARQGAQLMQTHLHNDLTVANSYSSITVAYLPQPIANGDALILYYTGYEQEVTVNNLGGYQSSNNPVTILVDPFTANFNYPIEGDNLPAPALGTVNFPGTVVYDPVWNATTLPLFQRHDFKDTKHRNVTYQAEATTAFAEYFYQTATATLTTGGPTPVDANGFVPGTVTVTGLPGAAPTNQNLDGVSFVDANHGWAAGAGGTTLVTYNGGSTWYPLSTGTTANINGVAFSDLNTGFLVGANGMLLTTTNGGEVWTALPNTPTTLNGISFVDVPSQPPAGWGVGANGAILTTANGGSSWSAQGSGTTANLYGVSFINPNTGWVVGSGGTILTTTNGGSTWSRLAAPTTHDLLGVSFVDTNHGWAVGRDGIILATTDGGTTWSPQTSPTNQDLTGVSFVSASGGDQGWAVGGNGQVFFTTHRGTNWIRQPLTYSPASATVTTTTLTSPLTANTPSTSLPVTALSQVALAGDTVTLGTGSAAPTTMVTASAPIGSTNIAVQSFTPALAIPSGTTVTVSGGDWQELDGSGSLALTPNSSIPNNTEVSVTFLANPITRLGQPAILDILSSDRPAAPSVRYAVPTFGWNQSITGTGIKSTKTGDTIRVYLERPWWSSGGGELLGVLLWHGPGSTGVTAPNQTIAPFVTMAGSDPVHGSPSIPLRYSLTTQNFPLAVATQAGTTIEELPTTLRFDNDKLVDVAGHTVQFDAARDLWFSDVEVDLGQNYWPFVRLALCRFQPDSINRSLPDGSTIVGANLNDDAYISRVILADFMQLAPDRTAVVTKTLTSPVQIGVTLTGLSYTSVDAGTGQSSSTPGPSLAFLTLEQELGTFSSDLAWQPVTDSSNNPIVVEMASTQQANGQTTWNASIVLPPTGGTFRLVIEEYEVYPTDMPTSTNASGASPGGPGLRLVHTDVISLGLERIANPLDATGRSGIVIESTNLGATWATLASGTGNALADIDVVTATSAVAVGQGGTIVATTNGGSSWSQQLSGTTRNLSGVAFADANHGWIVGQDGIILATANGGTTWAPQPSPTTTNLTGVSFSDLLHGWAVGQNGLLLATSDGGLAGSGSWAKQNSGTTQNLSGVSFPSVSNGWAVGSNGTVITTTNGGATWTAQHSGTTQNLNGVFFSDPLHGWAVGNSGTILATSNGGTTWTPQKSGTTLNLTGVAFFNPAVGIAVGLDGVVLITSDGGQTWYTPLPPNANLVGVSFITPTQGWAVGGNGVIEATTNGGSDWTGQVSGTTQYLTDVSFTNASSGWVVGDGGTILHTSNAGATWAPQTSGTTRDLVAVSFINAATGWILTSSNTLLTTTNGGATWSAVTPSGLSGKLLGMAFSNALHGWIVGNAGAIFTTTNGGATWTLQPSGSLLNLFGVSFVGASGWAVGQQGTILNTTNGGATWTAQSSGTTHNLNSVSFSDPNNGFAIGTNGTVLATSNGGTHWTVVGQYPTNNDLLGVE
jgi:photosystem II stability/assembly factor-like uncharacterized protein